MHVGDEVVHLSHHLIGLVNDQIRALGDDVQVIIGDQGGDLHDDVAGLVEAGHF